MADPKRPTVRAVVEYATKLRAEAERQMRADPYARPYYPTTAAARKLYQRMVNDELGKLGPHPTAEEIDQAQGRAGQRALEHLARKAVERQREHREEENAAAAARKRLVRRQREAQRDREAMRMGLTLGQRLDQALAKLGAIPAPAGTGFDGRVAGSDTHDPLRFPGDPAARARAKAREAVRFAEEELEDARRRRLEHEAA